MPVGTRSISLGMVTVLADISCSSWFGSAANFAANAYGLQKKYHEIEKKAPAQPELSSRSNFMTCFVVVMRMSF